MNILSGEIFAGNMHRYRHQGGIRFLNAWRRDIPVKKRVQVVLDNSELRKVTEVCRRLGCGSCRIFDFSRRFSSRLNAVDRFLVRLIRTRPERGVVGSVADLLAAINRLGVKNNQNAKSFLRRADPDANIAVRPMGGQALASIRCVALHDSAERMQSGGAA